MSQFTVDKSMDGDSLILTFKGHIDEDASFEGISFEDAKSIVIDLDHVLAINSCGIREWIKWIRAAPEGSQIEYRKAPKVIVDQINMVSGFLPENARVSSFYVPYYCDDTGAEKMILFKEGEQFQDGEVTPPEAVKDDDTGDEMEIDVIEAKYFKFLKGA